MAEDTDKENNNDIVVKDREGKETKGTDAFVFRVTTETLMFQFYMMVVACYYSMLYTNWGDPVVNNDKSNFFSSSDASFWIKIVIQWMSIGIYFVS